MRSAPPEAQRPPRVPFGFAAAFCFFFLIALFPLQVLPFHLFRGLFVNFPPDQFMIQPAHRKYAEFYEATIAEDLKAGRRVLVPHGTSMLLRNGVREVPLDRINSALELVAAGKEALGGTTRRVREKYYDRIYMPVDMLISSGWYGKDLEAAIKSNYRKTGSLPDVPTLDGRGIYIGLGLMVPIDILEPISDGARPVE